MGFVKGFCGLFFVFFRETPCSSANLAFRSVPFSSQWRKMNLEYACTVSINLTWYNGYPKYTMWCTVSVCSIVESVFLKGAVIYSADCTSVSCHIHYLLPHSSDVVWRTHMLCRVHFSSFVGNGTVKILYDLLPWDFLHTGILKFFILFPVLLSTDVTML